MPMLRMGLPNNRKHVCFFLAKLQILKSGVCNQILKFWICNQLCHLFSYSKTISKDEIKKLIELTEKNINIAFTDILKAKFDINPKRIGKNNVGCEFCKYKDICYMREEDIVNLEEYKDLEFLK